jgi:hypothetical protein
VAIDFLREVEFAHSEALAGYDRVVAARFNRSKNISDTIVQ